MIISARLLSICISPHIFTRSAITAEYKAYVNKEGPTNRGINFLNFAVSGFAEREGGLTGEEFYAMLGQPDVISRDKRILVYLYRRSSSSEYEALELARDDSGNFVHLEYGFAGPAGSDREKCLDLLKISIDVPRDYWPVKWPLVRPPATTPGPISARRPATSTTPTTGNASKNATS